MGKIDLTGQRFGRLVVICENGRAKNGSVIWLCKCSCGNEVTVHGSELRRGKTQSCGCFRRDRAAECKTKHGLNASNRRLYESIRHHFRAIKNSVGCYGDWQIDSRYTPDSTGIAKFCEDLIALQPNECNRYEKSKALDIDKDNDRDHIFRPESIVFVSRTKNLNNRKCTLRLSDGTALADFCRSIGIETYNQADRKRTKQYHKYQKWFREHNGEGHPELLKKANETVCIMRKCLRMLELLNEVRAFRESP